VNNQPAQQISHNGQQATTPINTAQLADIAELLALLDGFLRHADDIADRLADYLHTTGRDHPLGRRDHALLLVAVQTGLRVSELTGLCCRDVHLGAGSPRALCRQGTQTALHAAHRTDRRGAAGLAGRTTRPT
jgi:site-specific recombinase XerD